MYNRIMFRILSFLLHIIFTATSLFYISQTTLGLLFGYDTMISNLDYGYNYSVPIIFILATLYVVFKTTIKMIGLVKSRSEVTNIKTLWVWFRVWLLYFIFIIPFFFISFYLSGIY